MHYEQKPVTQTQENGQEQGFLHIVVQNMSVTIAKSCRLFQSIIICNIKSLPCTILEKIEFAQKMPGMPESWKARYLENQIFLDLKFSGMVPHIIFYHF